MSIFLILLAAGESKRLKSSIPKPYITVNNKKLLEQMAASGKQDSYEIILNENCPVGCAVRKPCYAVGARDAIKIGRASCRERV